jgi:hypothetical protein
MAAADGGHGTYLPAAMLFPYTMLISVAIGDVSPVLLSVALVQFPVYGSLLAFNQHRRRMWIALTCVHAVFAIAAFFLVMESKTFG